MSWVETLTSTAIGYTVACTSQVLIFPLYGIHLPVRQNLVIWAWFTIISIARGYVVRRAFNRIKR
jgi:hypothetical protein